MNRLIRRAMQQADDLVVEFDYTDAKGVSTRRVVSPIRFVGKGSIPGRSCCRAARSLGAAAMIRAWLRSGQLMPVAIVARN